MALAAETAAVGAGDRNHPGWIQALTDDGMPLGPPEHAEDLPAAVAEREREVGPRWVWASGEDDYSLLVRAGVRVARCHDAALVEVILLGREGRHEAPHSLAAASARLHGLPAPPDSPRAAPEEQSALFGLDAAADAPDAAHRLRMLVEVYADQVQRIAAQEREAPGLRLLAAAESAGALVAAEIAADGLPWRVDVHDAVLSEMLGPRPFGDARPAKLADLAVRVGEAFGHAPGRGFNPDSPGQVLKALRYAGFQVSSTRAWHLRGLNHPGVELLLEYKELSRLHTAHGWTWQDNWIRNGRYYPEYVVGGVVTGRWATRNSGALQIPRIMRRAVVADQGWKLVVADAGQLEPRVLAAVSGDTGLARAAGEGDLYAALAAEAFDGDRAAAKLGLLGAMYGQTSGGIGPLLAVLRTRFPAAMGFVEEAARAGESGRVVRSRLGRACPAPSRRWRAAVTGMGGEEERAEEGGVGEPGFDDAEADGEGDAAADFGRQSAQAARARGRFTRNFVIQATAAEWALVWLALLRRELAALAAANPGLPAPRLVFFVHDEVVVHTPQEVAAEVAEAVTTAADQARLFVFGPTPVRFPLVTAVVDCYADAK
ncbi:MAG TPA: bifunctional 3'-5' exonuclease/DNA polymerase [Actinocrinis sp.]|uniref:bifunctional 3'-5' exonuclease/DNA polymerase n=1 Tax=Actinocrinis sp. TaxID=1920516 RepID=UPI002DDD200B|nr:bifunctional 3'-5' exonuclease/DNA polymerase [Actinocrinis sp.]HEV3173924.1 bifunctional 3'-5' exonuclease/DNA polymerase [Actinocrinis sp.]